MSNQTIVSSNIPAKSVVDEHILVVRRDLLFPEGAWQGLKMVEYASYETLIRQNQEFLPRSRMETDPRYKQIIPYLVFTHEDRYFVMQRLAKATEQRLKSKLSVGIGGHINQQDISDGSIIDWARREFAEEVAYEGTFSIEPLGILNDDSTEVGQVHVGFIYLLRGSSGAITAKEEFKSGDLWTPEECRSNFDRMENWSQIVLQALGV